MSSWIAVASAEHVAVGRAGGFMQVCHGKAGPLRRMSAGDHVVYYSPTRQFRGRDLLQAFTALGVVRDAAPYRVEMAPGFLPYRRDVDWLPVRPASIRPLLPDLLFSAGKKNWAYPFRFGLVPIDDSDMVQIARAMNLDLVHREHMLLHASVGP
ncbi:EVE domain-containing protein [Tahibacter amnicola]|uniref:UPF0310 protein N4264_18045 n=1 Tax=Tahibacter amnicola TaxID=2976241 RepID=A0ABY6BE75_9GAMM|nr:EVE domain-containing protein [Tahibacter amnicola]UXI66640.1 EVE domain-containing protein [Tahibacter amnicola]